MAANPLRLLLIEPPDANSLADTLASRPGLKVQRVTTLTDALLFLQREKTEIALLDMALPGSTITLAVLLEQFPAIPVVALLDKDADTLATSVLTAGAADYITHSEIEHLMTAAQLQRIIRRHRIQQEHLRAWRMTQRRTESQLEAVIQQNADPILVIDKSGIVRFVNRSAESLFGISGADLVGASVGFPMAEHVTELDIWRDNQDAAVAEMRVVNIEWEGQGAYLASLRDITERKRNTEYLRAQAIRQAVMAQLGQMMLSEVDISSLIQTAIDVAVDVLDVSGAAVLAFEDDADYVKVQNGSGNVTNWPGRLLLCDALGVSIDTLNPHNPLILEEDAIENAEVLAEYGILSAVNVVISGFERHYGVLAIYDDKNRVFSLDHVYFIESVANMIAQVVERHRIQGELIASENRYRLISNLVSDFAYVIRMLPHGGGIIEWATDALVKILGGNREEIQRRYEDTIFEFIHPDDLGRVQHALLGTPASGTGVVEYRIVRPDGQVRWLRDYFQRFWHQHSERVAYLYGAAQDITAQKEAEIELRQSEARNKAMLDAVPDLIFLLSHDGVFLDVSFSYHEKMAIPHESVIGANIVDVFQGEIAQHFMIYIKAAISTTTMQVFEYQLEVLGAMQDYEARIVLSGEGEIMVLVRNITNRKASERQILESEARYRSIVELSPDAIVVLVDKKFAYVNPAAFMLMGVSRAEMLIGVQIDDFVSIQDDSMNVVRGVQTEWGEVTLQTWDLKRLDNEHREVEAFSVPIYYDGQPAVQVVLRDITQRKLRQRELVEAQLIRVELQKERELIDLKDRFISMVTHEFRTPLAIIQSSTELIERYYERYTPEDRNKRFERIYEQVQHMVKMLENVLTINRAGTGTLKFLPELTDVVAFCKESVETFQSTLKDQKIRFVNVGDTSYRMLLDRNLMRHILQNLLSNAAKYSPPSSEIVCQLTHLPKGIELSVTDKGIGIPLEDQKRLFEPFHRAGNVSTITGTGLGLAIVHECAELHGGHVSLHSQPNQGSTFTVWLPSSRTS